MFAMDGEAAYQKRGDLAVVKLATSHPRGSDSNGTGKHSDEASAITRIIQEQIRLVQLLVLVD